MPDNIETSETVAEFLKNALETTETDTTETETTEPDLKNLPESQGIEIPQSEGLKIPQA